MTMNRVVLQIPMSATLRQKAEIEAKSQGFSSLQEAIRVLLTKFTQKRLEATFQEPIQLSKRAIKRYDKMTEEIESGKVKSKAFDNVDDLMRHLSK